MQSSKIQVGTEYAFKPSRNSRTSYRVKVLEVGATEKVRDPYDRRRIRKTNTGMIRIQHLDKDYWVEGEGYVKPEQIVQPWAEEAEERDWRAKARQESIDRMKASAKTVKDILPKKVWKDTLQYESAANGTVHADGSFGTSVRLDIHELAAIVEAAYEAGRQAAKG